MSLSDVNPPMARPSTTTLVGHTVARMAASVALIFLVVSGNFMAGPPIFHWIPLVILTFTGVLGWLAIGLDRERLDGELLLAAVVPSVVAAGTASLSAYPSLSWDSAWHLSTLAGTALLVWYALARWGLRDFVVVLGSLLVLLVAGYLLQVVLAYQTWLSLGMSATTLPLRPLNAGSLALIPTWLSDYVILLAPVMVVIFGRAGRGGRWIAAALAVASVPSSSSAAPDRSGCLRPWSLADCSSPGCGANGTGVRSWASASSSACSRRSRLRWPSEGALRGASTRGGCPPSGPRSRVCPFADLRHWPGHVRRIASAVLRGVLDHLAFPNSHDVVLSTLAEEGLLGVLALAIVVACCLVVVRRRWREPSPDTRSPCRRMRWHCRRARPRAGRRRHRRPRHHGLPDGGRGDRAGPA